MQAEEFEERAQRIEETLITTQAVVNALLHNFQSDDSTIFPTKTTAGLLAQVDDNINLLFTLTVRSTGGSTSTPYQNSEIQR